MNVGRGGTNTKPLKGDRTLYFLKKKLHWEPTITNHKKKLIKWLQILLRIHITKINVILFRFNKWITKSLYILFCFYKECFRACPLFNASTRRHWLKRKVKCRMELKWIKVICLSEIYKFYMYWGHMTSIWTLWYLRKHT